MARRQILTGVEDVRRVFRRLPEENVRKITHALNQSAEEVAARARQLAPHDPNTPIDLADQIEVRISTKLNRRRGLKTTEPNSVAAYVVAGDTPARRGVAWRMEFGRRPGPKGHPGFGPRPFMFPAYYSLRKRIIGRVRRAVKAAAKAVSAARRSGG